jgi:hypothetical protein
MAASLAPLTIVGSSLGVLGYFPELRRVLWVAGAQPASQLLWFVWVLAAALNLAYAWAVDAPPLLVCNYGAHLLMCAASSAANLRLVWRLHCGAAAREATTTAAHCSSVLPAPVRWSADDARLDLRSFSEKP